MQVTSAVDAFTEKEILDSLREVAEDKTTLVIAHRLASIMDADLIIVMHKGEVVEVRRETGHRSAPPVLLEYACLSAWGMCHGVATDGHALYPGPPAGQRVRTHVGHPGTSLLPVST